MTKKAEIYQLLVGTHPSAKETKFYAKKIAYLLGVTHPYVAKIIKQLINDGYVIPQGKKTCPMFYSATAKIPIRGDVTIPTPKDVTKSEPSSELFQQEELLKLNRGKGAQSEIVVQKARYEIIIEREYSDFFDGLKLWMHGNCEHRKFKAKVFDHFGEFSFEKVGKSKLIVIIPEMIFKKEELAIAKHAIFSIAYESLKWFAKEAKVKFKWNTMHLCQKPHICRPAKDSKAIRVARDYSLSIDGKMLDMSSGKADWETTVFDEHVVDAVDALEQWDMASVVKSEMEEFSRRILDVESSQPEIIRKVESIAKDILELKEMMTPKAKSVDDEDPAFS